MFFLQNLRKYQSIHQVQIDLPVNLTGKLENFKIDHWDNLPGKLADTTNLFLL